MQNKAFSPLTTSILHFRGKSSFRFTQKDFFFFLLYIILVASGKGGPQLRQQAERNFARSNSGRQSLCLASSPPLLSSVPPLPFLLIPSSSLLCPEAPDLRFLWSFSQRMFLHLCPSLCFSHITPCPPSPFSYQGGKYKRPVGVNISCLLISWRVQSEKLCDLAS